MASAITSRDAVVSFLRRHAWSAVLAGWLISRFVLSLPRMIHVGSVVVAAGFLAALYAAVRLPSLLFTEADDRIAVHVLNGIIADSVFYWIVRPGMGAPLGVTGPWDPVVFAGSGAGLVVMLAATSLAGLCGARIRAATRAPTRWHALLAGAGVVGAIVVFRVSNVMLRDLPNEDRSLFIAGCEVHHAVTGALLVALLGMLLATRCLPNALPVALACGVASGFVLDQTTYLMLRNVSDEAYFGAASLAGACAAAIVYVIALVYLWRSRRGTG